MKKFLYFLVFIISPILLFTQNKIVEYEYWFNDNYSTKVSKQVTATKNLNLSQEINVKDLKHGFNWFNIRFKDSKGNWSSIYTKLFFKVGIVGESQADTINKIVEYEYWFNENYNNKISKKFPTLQGASFIEEIDVKDLKHGFNWFHIRFKDSRGGWSSTYTKMFFKVGKEGHPQKDSINEILAYRYWFDDKFKEAKQINFDEPKKLAQILDIIEIPLETAESFSIQFLDVSGLWSPIYTKKFLPEANFEVFNTLNTFNFLNLTNFGKEYIWNFGDGNKSTVTHPSHTYKQPGVYNVSLIAKNKLGTDTFYQNVFVYGLREVTPQTGGNTGEVSLFIYGAGFDDNTKVFLIDKSGNKIEPISVQHYKLDALKCSFNLKDKPIGTYDVVAQFKGKEYKLEQSFKILEGTKPEPYVFVVGRDRILRGRWQTYTLNFGNKGNVDALGVPIILILSEKAELEVEFPELVLNQNPKLQNDTNYQKYWKDLPEYFKINQLFDEPFNGRVYYFYIPRIPANYNGSMQIRIKSSDDIRILAWTTGPYFMSPLDSRVDLCIRLAIIKAIKDGIIGIGLQNAPIAGCIYNFWSEYLEPYLWESGLPKPDPSYNRPRSWKESFFYWGNQLWDFSILLANCLADFVGPLKAYQIAIQIITLINDIKKNYLTEKDCRERYQSEPRQDVKIPAVASFDPNEIVGPPGFTDYNFTTNKIGYTYTIYFENLKTATAPAQEVIIIDTLDPKVFNFKTFSFGKITWGHEQITPLPNMNEFSIDVSLKPKNPNILRISGKFDTTTGIVRWHFITLDTATMDLPEDPDGGFLPPNKIPPEGEGSVQFSIQLKSGLQHNIAINNRAIITFDLNPPIFTNLYSNHLDLEPPKSRLNHIYKINYMEPNTFKITGTASDEGSGVKYRTIFASINNGEYFPIANMTSDEIFIKLEPDSIYKFYSIAVDSVGNIENHKTTFEVSTLNVSVDESNLKPKIFAKISPNPTADILTINYESLVNGNGVLYISDIEGRIVYFEDLGWVSEGVNTKIIETENLTIGSYVLCLSINNTKFVTMFEKKK